MCGAPSANTSTSNQRGIREHWRCFLFDVEDILKPLLDRIGSAQNPCATTRPIVRHCRAWLNSSERHFCIPFFPARSLGFTLVGAIGDEVSPPSGPDSQIPIKSLSTSGPVRCWITSRLTLAEAEAVRLRLQRLWPKRTPRFATLQGSAEKVGKSRYETLISVGQGPHQSLDEIHGMGCGSKQRL